MKKCLIFLQTKTSHIANYQLIANLFLIANHISYGFIIKIIFKIDIRV